MTLLAEKMRHHGACPRGPVTGSQIRSIENHRRHGARPRGATIVSRAYQSWLHGDKPRGGHRYIRIAYWPPIIDPPGQARWSCRSRTLILVITPCQRLIGRAGHQACIDSNVNPFLNEMHGAVAEQMVDAARVERIRGAVA